MTSFAAGRRLIGLGAVTIGITAVGALLSLVAAVARR
jgi:hypothetical protein